TPGQRAGRSARHAPRGRRADRVPRVGRGLLHHRTGHRRGRRPGLNGTSRTMDTLRTEIKQAIVRALKLPMQPEDIDDAAPLFGDGLGLDSIDALELVLEIERTFGVVIGDEETGGRVLRSVDSIAAFIEEQRKTA